MNPEISALRNASVVCLYFASFELENDQSAMISNETVGEFHTLRKYIFSGVNVD